MFDLIVLIHIAAWSKFEALLDANPIDSVFYGGNIITL
jgi:hypothetical protein